MEILHNKIKSNLDGCVGNESPMAENLVRGFIILFHFLFYHLLNIEPTIFRQK